MKRNLLVVSFVLGVGLCMGIAEDKKGPSTPGTQSSLQTVDSKYVIGPEDVLNISVWKEPDVSGSVPVRPDGKISLPLLNDVQAAGLTPMQLTDDLTEKLKQFITDPRVTVTVSTVNSRRVYVLGEVT